MHGFNPLPWTLRRRLAWRLGAACSAGLLLAGAVMAAQQQAPAPVLIRFSHVVAHDTPKGQMALRFKALVQERSGGRLRVEVYPDSQLYGDDDEMEALQLGAVEMLAPSLSKFGAVGVPEFEVFDLPFLFHDLAQVRCVTQGPAGRQLLERLSRQQMVGLGFLDNGFKQMSAGQPVRNVQDFRGLRLRVQASRVLTAQMRSLGAYPVVLPFGETQRALASRRGRWRGEPAVQLPDAAPGRGPARRDADQPWLPGLCGGVQSALLGQPGRRGPRPPDAVR